MPLKHALIENEETLKLFELKKIVLFKFTNNEEDNNNVIAIGLENEIDYVKLIQMIENKIKEDSNRFLKEMITKLENSISKIDS